jgi:hypothetical protein
MAKTMRRRRRKRKVTLHQHRVVYRQVNVAM